MTDTAVWLARMQVRSLFGRGKKYRVNRGREFVIGGYTPGNPFDALIAAIMRAIDSSMLPR